MVRLFNADKMLKRLESWNTDDEMDKALYNFTLDRIIEQPTVDAIPIDFIEKEAEKMRNSKNPAIRLNSVFLSALIRDWRKNGTDL